MNHESISQSIAAHGTQNHTVWRLYPHPPPALIMQSTAATARTPHSKYNGFPKLNDCVYIRPKSAKELGVVGRVIDISSLLSPSCSVVSNPPSTFDKTAEAAKCSKKRKMVESIRLSIQPLCLEHSEVDEDLNCDVCERSKFIKKDVRPSRSIPVYDITKNSNSCDKIDNSMRAQSFVILTPDTANYRLLATSHLRPNDKVLEIGCSTGECTSLILRRFLLLHSQYDRQQNNARSKCKGHIVAFDTGSEMIDQARRRLLLEMDNAIPPKGDEIPNNNEIYSQMVRFHKVDAIADPKGAYSYAAEKINTHSNNNRNQHPDMVLIDIGGNRELNGILRMIQWVQTAFSSQHPRILIIKSEAIVDSLTQNCSSGAKSEECGIKKTLEDVNGSSDATKECRDKITSISEAQPYITANGIVEHAQQWISSLISQSQNEISGPVSSQPPPKYSHPKRAPLVFSPKDNTTPICRFHNYHPDGCKKYNCDRNECPFDHDHCHWCLTTGHIALNCPKQRL